MGSDTKAGGGRPQRASVAFEAILLQVGGEHTMLAGRANYQSVGAMSFLVWMDFSLEYNHTDPSPIGTVHVAIRAGLATCMRVVDDKLFETI